MNRPVLLAAALTLALCGSGSDAMTRPAPAPVDLRQCFTSASINSYVQQDDWTLNVRARVRDVYQLTLMEDCRDIRFARGVVFNSQSQAICSGIDLTLLVPNGLAPRRCDVRAIRRLTPEDIAALPAQARP